MGVGGWDPQILVGQRVEIMHARRRRAGRRRAQGDPPAARGGAREGPQAARPAHRHRRQGRRRGARARAHRRRRGDRRRAARAAQRPRHLALDGQPPRRLHRARGGAARRRGRRRARATSPRSASSRRRSRSAARARRPIGSSPTSRSSSTSRTRPARPASRSTRSASTSSARDRSSSAARSSTRSSSSCCTTAAEREEIPFTVQASARSTGTDADAIHLQRAGIPTGGVSVDAALHALARGDGPARRRARLREADRRVRAVAQRRDVVRARLGPAPRPSSPACSCSSTSTARCCSRAADAHRDAIHEALRVVHGVTEPQRRERRGRRDGPTATSRAACS